VPNESWVFLETAGSGVFYGMTHSMRGLIPAGNRRNYLEGDERVYVDGAVSPAIYGSEDFYEAGWHFRDGTTHTMPTAGNQADVADDASRTEHGYKAAGETRAVLESTVEERADTVPLSRGVTAATGEVSFTIEVASDNRVGPPAPDGRPECRLPMGNSPGERQGSGELLNRCTTPAPAGWRTTSTSQQQPQRQPSGRHPTWSAATYRTLSHNNQNGHHTRRDWSSCTTA
jgi:hypothetical protein